MENTEELDIDIEDIGTILKSSRLKSKKSLEEISSELCIRKIYLIALEDGDYETLPPIPYGVGYVRTYARYLGLNPERAVKLYKNASKTEDQNQEEDIAEKTEANKISGKHLIVGIMSLIAIYAIWSFYANITTPQSQSTQNLAPEISVSEEIANSEIQEGTLAEDVQTNEQPTESMSETVINTPETADDLKQTPIPEEPEVAEEKVEDNKVVVEFLNESWVELKDKNKVYFQGVFHKGDKKEIDYIGNLFLSVGRPENVKVYIKGTEKNILAKKRKMNIPLDSLD